MEPQKTPSQQHFEKVMRRLVDGVVMGMTHLKIGRGVGDAIRADGVILGVSQVFWGTTISAQLDTAQLIAFKLFDERKGSMTVEYLLALADQCSGSFQKATSAQVAQITQAARTKISELEPILRPLRAKRNRILAHSDPTMVRDPVRLAKQTTVTFADLESIFATAGQILNEISVAYCGACNSFDIIDGNDFDHAIQLIADAKHHQAEVYEERNGLPRPFLRPKRPKSEF